MPTGWNPREPRSRLRLFKTWATCMQCSDWKKKNSRTTTLPLKLEREVLLPEEGSEMLSSGDLRGTWACGCASAEIAQVATTSPSTMEVNVGLFIGFIA